jgi:ATP-dependent Clp protease ATP-binding subunit ClpC
MPLQHLDAHAQAIVDLANQIAREYEIDYVGTEHILLAILRHHDNVGAGVLHSMGVTEQRAREKIDELVQRSKEDTWVFGRLPGSPHFRNVIARAIEEAGQLEARKIGSEHLLLALLREKHSTAQQALALLGVSLKRCRDEILRVLSAKPG